jgi:hypothetical protein
MTLNIVQCRRSLRNARRDHPSLQTFQRHPVTPHSPGLAVTQAFRFYTLPLPLPRDDRSFFPDPDLCFTFADFALSAFNESEFSGIFWFFPLFFRFFPHPSPQVYIRVSDFEFRTSFRLLKPESTFFQALSGSFRLFQALSGSRKRNFPRSCYVSLVRKPFSAKNARFPAFPAKSHLDLFTLSAAPNFFHSKFDLRTSYFIQSLQFSDVST